MASPPRREYSLVAKGWCSNIYRVEGTDLVCKATASSCLDAFQSEKIAYDLFEEAFNDAALWNPSLAAQDVEDGQSPSTSAPGSVIAVRTRREWKSNILAYFGPDTSPDCPDADADTPLRPPSPRVSWANYPRLPRGLLFSYMSHGSLSSHLRYLRHIDESDRDARGDMSAGVLIKWARQAAEGLAFAHHAGVLHGDIYLSNFLIDGNYDLKIGDWGGACIRYTSTDAEGREVEKYSMCRSIYRSTHRLADYGPNGEVVEVLWETVSVRSEVFALGSALYVMAKGGGELWKGELQQETDADEIRRRICRREMPETEGLCLASVMEGCWRTRFPNMVEVREAILAEERRILALDQNNG